MGEIEDLQRVEMVIELDKGRSIQAVAEKFRVTPHLVRELAQTAGIVTPSPRKIAKKNRTTPQDKEKLIDQIMEGEEVETVALQFDVSSGYVRRLCLQQGIQIPKTIHQLSAQECQEIKALLQDNPPWEIAEAYQTSLAVLEKIQEPAYKQIDPSTLAWLFEIYKNEPNRSPRAICEQGKKEGKSLTLRGVISYRERLKQLEALLP